VRRTIVVRNRHALRMEQVRAAQAGDAGLTLLTIEHLASRLAGGFAQPIGSNELLGVIPAVLERSLGELDEIKRLPGFQRAAARTLSKAWSAGVDLKARAKSAPTGARSRFEALVLLEAGILERLAPKMYRPVELIARGIARIEHARRLFGPIEVRGFTELEPVWRAFLQRLAGATDLVWDAGPRHVPQWVAQSRISISARPVATPTRSAQSCADQRHEALEAFRWARALLSQGRACPEEIAIATASPQGWDDYFSTLETLSGVDLHFVHGRPALNIADGQLVAALAEALLLGISKIRMARLVALLRTQIERFREIPVHWQQGLPQDAPLLDVAQWPRVLDALTNREDGKHVCLLREIVDALTLGLPNAQEVGERLLTTIDERNQPRADSPSVTLWRQALLEGPAQALDVTIASLRVPDKSAPEASIIWTPACELAAAPRPYVWLLGLASRAWPRRAGEDPLLPDHVIATEELDPLPVHQADRRDFTTIVATTTKELVYSRARRDAQGRANGKSPLYPRDLPELYRKRARIPEHAAFDADRLFARPEEFADQPLAQSTLACWNDWNKAEVTAHDGLVRANHPVASRALGRRQSATSLAMLVRDPLGYLWTYAFGWDAPDEAEQPLQLDALAFGTLLHAVAERAVTELERRRSGGFGAANDASLRSSVDEALAITAREWEADRPIPPHVLWKRTLEDVRDLANRALTFAEEPLAGQRSWAEISFGGSRAQDISEGVRERLPWDPALAVCIPGTDIHIGGTIDRLDLSGDAAAARVTDYKSGKAPIIPPVLKGGAELQRCLYAFAVATLIPNVRTIQTRLLYPRALRENEPGLFPLPEAAAVVEQATAFFVEARRLVAQGNALCGEGVDPTRGFALPASASEWYLPKKRAARNERLGTLPALWDMA
jgi:hypothetical protein